MPVLVQENQYDGRKLRTLRNTYSSGTLSDSRDFYYTDSWQTLEERVSGIVDRQYVWGLRYIDDLVLRDRTTGSGSLAERLYAMQDDNWNMAAIYDPTSSAIRSASPTRPTASCSRSIPPISSFPYTGTDYDWTILFTGRAGRRERAQCTTGPTLFAVSRGLRRKGSACGPSARIPLRVRTFDANGVS